MKHRIDKRNLLPLVLLCASVMLLAAAVASRHNPGDTDSAARRTQRIVASRMNLLEMFAENEPKAVPEDMIIYRYKGDSLYRWTNQFDVRDDNLSSPVLLQTLSNPRGPVFAPLSAIADTVSFVNFGSGWYLAKSISGGDGAKVIIGIEISNTARGNSLNGVNPRLRLGDHFSVKPLSFSGGSAVYVDGRPQFKVMYESLEGSVTANATLLWLAFVFLIGASVSFILARRTFSRYLFASIPVAMSVAAMYVWGFVSQTDLPVFSPTLFAGGRFLFSIGAVFLVNLAILFGVGGLFLVRKDFSARFRTRYQMYSSLLAVVVALGGILLYTFLTLKSIIFNSGITLELYKLRQITVWTALVYLSFISVLATVPLLLHLAQYVTARYSGWHLNMFSVQGRIVWSLLISAGLVSMIGILGIEKEQNRAEVWANRLAVDRDLLLELQLRGVEGRIAEDVLIPTLATLDNAANTIRSRIQDYYFSRFGQNYDISVFLQLNPGADTPESDFIESRLRGGLPISDGSHFSYSDTGLGHSRYDGVFFYFIKGLGTIRIVVEFEPRLLQASGYSRIAGVSAPGAVVLPAIYSYAHYKGNGTARYSGSYAYPTELGRDVTDRISGSDVIRYNVNGYSHFLFRVADDEYVIISRPQDRLLGYALSLLIVALAVFAVISLLTLGRPKRRVLFEKSYFKPRILLTITGSLMLTMVVMATVSVLFVYQSNEMNIRRIVSEKVTSIQAMIMSQLKGPLRTEDIVSQDAVTMLNGVSANTFSDITLFDPHGVLIFSTSRMAYSTIAPGCRMDSEAFGRISREHRRYFVKKCRIRRTSFYNMYAPITDETGHLVAILCSPYIGRETYLYERDAIMHSVTILIVFILMFSLARIIAEKIVDNLFRPILVMSHRMSTAGLDSMDFIEYDRDDEIASLVRAYNRMVTDLSESTKKLAQAERDKAWSEMARQVAHEIKNPLTPMKLQIQRIIRLKAKGDSAWQEKFEEAAKVLLDHIDILTDTANEFSTFAKLYSEDPVRFNLDSLVQEEISMFDNHESVEFEYIGFKEAMITGPKPQLTRVIVNLLGNAVQAVEGVEGGRIRVSLRKGVEEGFYDLVVEDNGPGVAKENEEKLFAPNFTTKSAGSGLGLAISRSILAKCGGTIEYSRSYALGGACFTVRYPG